MASSVQGNCSTGSLVRIRSRGEGSSKLRIRSLRARFPGLGPAATFGAPRFSFGPIIQVTSESGNSFDKKGGDLLNGYNIVKMISFQYFLIKNNLNFNDFGRSL